jgi:hypothetical protein
MRESKTVAPVSPAQWDCDMKTLHIIISVKKRDSVTIKKKFLSHGLSLGELNFRITVNRSPINRVLMNLSCELI